MRFDLIEQLDDAFNGHHMQPDIHAGEWWEVQTSDGTYYFPRDYFTEDSIKALDDVQAYKSIRGFGARLSAPGYLDSTDWDVFPTWEDAAAHLLDTYTE